MLTADKGRYAGGIITMETQSGTNLFHGRAFIYFRNENLNSNDWTDNSLGNSRQIVQPEELWRRSGRTGAHSSPVQRHGPHLLLRGMGRGAIQPGTGDRKQHTHGAESSKAISRRQSSTTTTALRSTPISTTRSTAPTTRTRPIARGRWQTSSVRRAVAGFARSSRATRFRPLMAPASQDRALFSASIWPCGRSRTTRLPPTTITSITAMTRSRRLGPRTSSSFALTRPTTTIITCRAA